MTISERREKVDRFEVVGVIVQSSSNASEDPKNAGEYSKVFVLRRIVLIKGDRVLGRSKTSDQQERELVRRSKAGQ